VTTDDGAVTFMGKSPEGNEVLLLTAACESGGDDRLEGGSDED